MNLILKDEVPQAGEKGKSSASIGHRMRHSRARECGSPVLRQRYRKMTRDGNEKVKVGIRSDTHGFFHLIIQYNTRIFIGTNETAIKASALPK